MAIMGSGNGGHQKQPKEPISRKVDILLWVIAIIITGIVVWGLWAMNSQTQGQVTNAQTQSHELPVTPEPDFEARHPLRNSHSKI